MKQNPCAVICKAPEAPGVGFDELDQAIEVLCASISDRLLAVSEQTLFIAAQHF